MVKLKRIVESSKNKLNLQFTAPLSLWLQSKDYLDQTDLIPLSSLGLRAVRVIGPHSLQSLYINSKDKQSLIEIIEQVREDQSDSITVMTINREIDHSIDHPNDYPVDSSGLFTQSKNEVLSFIPSQIAQGLKELRKRLLQEAKVRINIKINTPNGVSLNRSYHLDTNSTRATILTVWLKYKHRVYEEKDIDSIRQLKGFLLSVLSDNPLACSIISTFNFTSQFSTAQQAREVKGILYFSTSPQANDSHKIGPLDFSYSNNMVNIVPTAAVRYQYGFVNGELVHN